MGYIMKLYFIVMLCGWGILRAKPQGFIKYLGVDYDVYKYVPSKKMINGYKGYLNTGDRVTVVCIPATTRGVLELTTLENQSIYKKLLGYYNTLKDESRCYVFLDELAD